MYGHSIFFYYTFLIPSEHGKPGDIQFLSCFNESFHFSLLNIWVLDVITDLYQLHYLVSVFKHEIYFPVIASFVIKQFTAGLITFFNELCENKILHEFAGVRRMLYGLRSDKSIINDIRLFRRPQSHTGFCRMATQGKNQITFCKIAEVLFQSNLALEAQNVRKFLGTILTGDIVYQI